MLLGYLLAVLAMMHFEERFVFLPTKGSADPWKPRGLSIEDARFTAEDGTRLHGWYARHVQPRAVVLFCHGNGGNIGHRADLIAHMVQQVGASILVFDYRGYGESEGQPTERGVLADARAARAWLARRENLPEARIVLMGESLGGAVAVDLAADGARALVLQNTFSSLPEVAAHHFHWLPVRWLMQTRFDSLSKIGQYHGPLLQSHAECDTIVPIESGRRLFEAAKGPKQFLLNRNCDHNADHSAEYYDALTAFLGSVP